MQTNYTSRAFQITAMILVATMLTGLFLLVAQAVILLDHHQHLNKIHSAQILYAFWIGFRFDLQMILYALAPAYVLALLMAAFYKAADKIITGLERYAIVVAIVMITASVCNYFYFQAFGHGFDQSIFLIEQGNLSANLETIWQDYAIFQGLVLIVVLSLVFALILLRVKKSIKNIFLKTNPFFTVLFLIVIIGTYAVLARGSVGLFPLRIAYTQFSNSDLLNSSSINAPLAIYQAFKNRKSISSLHVVNLLEGKRYFQQYSQTQAKNFKLQSLFTRTRHNTWLASHKPNVVFVQMESMGNNFLQFQNDKTNNLLGALEKYYKHDYVFRYFLSGENGTEASLARFVVSSPDTGVLSHPLLNVALPSSIILPFKHAGYETIFLTSGDLGWGNFGKFFFKQGIDKAFGKWAIEQRYPKAKTDAWGVYDHYVFLYAQYLLKQAYKENKPVFIYINTVTNHPPYSAPSDYHRLPLDKNIAERLTKFMNIEQGKAERMLLAYQYVNNSLGLFLDSISSQPWGADTIVGASGDHNQHEMIPAYSQSETFFFQHSVPFLLHIPKMYKPKFRVETARVASHKDVFPTLINLALSNARYLNNGANLLATPSKQAFSFGTNPGEDVISGGIIRPGHTALFYPFVSKHSFDLLPGRPLNRQQQHAYNRIIAYNNLMNWQKDWQETCLLSGHKHPKNCMSLSKL